MSFARDPKYTDVVAHGMTDTVDGNAKDRKGTPAGIDHLNLRPLGKRRNGIKTYAKYVKLRTVLAVGIMRVLAGWMDAFTQYPMKASD